MGISPAKTAAIIDSVSAWGTIDVKPLYKISLFQLILSAIISNCFLLANFNVENLCSTTIGSPVLRRLCLGPSQARRAEWEGLGVSGPTPWSPTGRRWTFPVLEPFKMALYRGAETEKACSKSIQDAEGRAFGTVVPKAPPGWRVPRFNQVQAALYSKSKRASKQPRQNLHDGSERRSRSTWQRG